MPIRNYFLPAVLIVLVASGCSTVATQRVADPQAANLARVDDLGDCARYLVQLDGLVETHAVADAQYARIPPYLRTNRFMSSGLKPESDTREFDAWVDALMKLGHEARDIEYANLPARALDKMGENRNHECAERLRNSDLSELDAKARLREVVRTSDSYRVAHRILGLYPLASIPFELGIKRLQGELEEMLLLPLANLPVEGTLSRYVHDTALADLSVRQVSRIIQRASDTPLGIPLPQGIDLKRLFATFSPVWEIDVVSEDDHLGTPYWPVEAITPAVDPAQPVTYTLLSHIRLGNETLLQLNYVMWFRARPRTGVLDLLGGPVDGITWRVTLRADGEVAFYYTMHNCGCYHMVFPTSNVRVVKRQSGHEEPLLIAPRNIAAGGHPVVRVQSATHYIQQVYFEEVELARGITYPLRAYDELRSLPFSTRRRRSFFDPDGLVPGTERGERWLFWPMGVPEPGAMRQWGTHAIAFVGRRHFDDPNLFAPYLELLALVTD